MKYGLLEDDKEIHKMYINNDIDYIKYLKNKKIVIFGAGKQGKKAYHNLVKNIENIQIIAFCDNDRKKQDQIIDGIRVISADELCKINTNDIFIIVSCFEREIREQLMTQGIYNFITISQIDFGGSEEYYDQQYFEWQKKMGEFGGKIGADMFKQYIREDMAVVEFGGGGGYLLSNITAKEKVNIEINDTARIEAEKLGIRSVKNIREIEDKYADIIISTNVLEHVENPLGVLRELHPKLKDGGKIVFYVPNESCDKEYSRSEINNHLYTWNCLNIGNLFKAAGYFVYSVRRVQEVWPKNYLQIYREVSPEMFEMFCDLGRKAFDENRCLIVAFK